MANSLAALKNLPCPAGSNCTAFQCLFKHPGDADIVATSKLPVQSLPGITATSSDQVTPRKRIKLDSVPSAPSHGQPTQQGTMSFHDEPQSGKQSDPRLTMDQTRPFLATETDQGEGRQDRSLQGDAYKGKTNPGKDHRRDGVQGHSAQRGNTQREGAHGGSYQGVHTTTDNTNAENIERTEADSTPHDAGRGGSIQSSSYKDGSYFANSREQKSSFTSPSTAQAQSNPTSSSTSHVHNNSTSSLSHVRNTSVSSTLKTRNNSTTSSATPTRTLSKSTTKTTPKEPESLNPRLLKKSPSQHDTRLKLVKALHEQYVRLNSELKKDATDKESKQLVLSDQELIVKALDDEEEMAIKRFAIYGNAIRNRIMTYKRMTLPQWKQERMASAQAGKAQTSTTASDAPKPIITGLTTRQEVDYARRLVWPFKGLTAYGYVSSVPSADDIKAARASVEASGNVEVCDRCTRRFQVFPGRREEDGALASNGTCTYHPGKFYYTERGPGKNSQGQKKYRCCHQNVNDDSGGCTTASTHVFKTTDINRLASLLNFAETPPNPNVPADRAVCFDCEMGYTVYGLELIRMTAVSWPDYEVLVDILVQPFGEVLDLNTRYSGVTPEDMVSAERWVQGEDHRPVITQSTEKKPKLKIASDPQAARNLLFSLIAPETPLIGHGLENDLNAVRVIHPTCIDTILLYPHKRGLPNRNGLKYLMDTLLNQKIQQEADEGAPEGHDSAEDAKAAGDLVRLKVRDEWKELQMKGWTIQDGKITPPDQEWSVVGGTKGKKRAF
ncbi:hypothetical protein F5Y06DRAFT_280511 [Hypoxylon sp. FL0890]|nr:hypothetical protein F5Y06DRAFT_280511 [Hypoxylon sp. FL0890]